MAHQSFDQSEFISVRYYMGTHGCPASTTRYNYYGMAGVPNLMFNGIHFILGAGTAAATGEQYMDIVRGRYFDPSPIKIAIDSFEPTTGAVNATVTMYSTTTTLTNESFHIILYENDIAAEHTEVARDLYSDTISLTGAGNTAVFNTTFTIDPTWNTSNLVVIAIVQKQDKEILQAATSAAQPTSTMRAMVPFSRNTIGPPMMPFETDPVTFVNVGDTGTFTIDLVIDEAPPGSTFAFRDSGGTLHTNPYGFSLTGDESTTFTAVVNPGSAGLMKFHFAVTSGAASTLEVPFLHSTDDVDVLLVDDDGWYDYEGYFTAALEDAGFTYGVWDLGWSKLTDDVTAAINLLIWNVGLAYPTLDPVDRVFLADYLDAGKSLFITGQDIGWDLNTSSSGNADSAFYQGYLHAIYVYGDADLYDVDGIPGDPISNQMALHIAGGDGANNQEHPNWVEPIGEGVRVFKYQAQDWGAGVRSVDIDSSARVVYLAFGYEAIDNAADRTAVMDATVSWLLGRVFVDGFESSSTSAWSNVLP